MAANVDGSNSRLVMSEPGIHLSYPGFCSLNGKEIFCAESAYSNRTTIYEKRAASLHEIAVIEQPIVDPTLLYHEGYYWLFGTLKGSSANSDLYIWYSEDIESQWTPHPANPVISDCRCARPAGAFVVEDTDIFRPAQNCETSYGCAVTICKIVKLSTTEYQQIEVTTIAPQDTNYPDGLHTINIGKEFAVLDGKRRIFHPLAWLIKLRDHLFGLT